MWLDDLTLETVIVHTAGGPSFKGVKAAVHEDCLVLRDAQILEDDAATLLNGEIVVPREQVAFLQLVAS